MKISISVLCLSASLLFFFNACSNELVSENPGQESSQEKEVLPQESGTTDAAVKELQAEVTPKTEEKSEISCKLSSASFEASQGSRIELTAISKAAETSIQFKNLPTEWKLVGKGKRVLVRIPYKIEGKHTLQVVLFCNDQRQEIPVEVNIRKLSWKKVSDETAGGPPHREHAKMWFDHTNKDELWFWGGTKQKSRKFVPLHDLWSYNFAKKEWKKHGESKNDPKLDMPMAVQIKNKPQLFVFGGNLNNITQAEPYYFDYKKNEWTKVEKLSLQYQAATLGAIVQDTTSTLERFLLFGGFKQTNTGYEVHSNVSFFTPSADDKWYMVGTKTKPSGRYGTAYVLDEENSRLVVHSGGQKPTATASVNPSNETWVFSTTWPHTWKKLQAKKNGLTIPTFRNACYAMDPKGQRMFIFGGTPDARYAHEKLVVLHLDDGKEEWFEVDLPGQPAYRASCSAVYDEKRKQILFAHGNNTRQFHHDIYALTL